MRSTRVLSLDLEAGDHLISVTIHHDYQVHYLPFRYPLSRDVLLEPPRLDERQDPNGYSLE